MLRPWVRIIAGLEIVGGVFGVGIVAWWFLAAPVNTLSLLLAPVPVGINVLSFVAGVALWRGSEFGRKCSMAVQAIQAPKIISPAVVFMFSFGFDLWVHYLVLSEELANLGAEVRFLAFFQLSFGTAGVPVGLGLSITACLSLALLSKYKPGEISAIDTPPPPPPAEWGDAPNAAPNNGIRCRALDCWLE